MAFKYTGDAALGVALTVETPKPLDNRTVVNNLDELYSIPEKYAYQGMTVANIDNGNIYMLIDKSKIKYKEGWKASYESIQIITCTEAEYKEWSENTTDDFRPIDESKPYLHAETYYYIYEDSLDDNQFYLSAEWGKKIEEQLKQKALNTTVVQIRTDLDNTIASLSDYATLEELTTNYVSNDSLALSLTKYYTKEYLDQNYHTTNQYQSWVATNYYSKKQIDEIVQGLQKLGNYVTTEDIKAYYTIQQVDDKFLTKENAQSTYATQQSLSNLSDQIAEDYVTKESLRGDSPETGDDDFIFVTQKKYQDDQAAAAKEFSTELLKSTSVETSDITIQKIGEKEVQQGTTGEPSEETRTEQVIESSVKLTTEDNRLFAGGKQVAITEEVPKLVCLPQADYDDLVENSKTEEDTYYCTYGEKDLQDTGYVRSEYLIERYYTKAEVEKLISQAVAELQKKIDALQPGSSVEVDGENEQLIF